MKPYIVYTSDYAHHVGGVKTLHKLCHELRMHGYEAYVTSKISKPGWDTPYAESVKDPIVIYPEVVQGNPLDAKYVIRYLLNKPGEVGKENNVTTSDLKIYFTRVYAPENGYVLFVPTIEEKMFLPSPNTKRYLQPYWIGKAKGEIIPSGNLRLTPTFPVRRQAMAEIFKHSTLFTSYYPLTALITEATFCGCPVLIDNHSQFTEEQFLSYEYGTDGIAWSAKDLERAKQTVDKAYQNYLHLLTNFSEKLNLFVAYTQDYFN